jgi:enoyl-CoA hydratase/carnithine racemase
LTHTLPLLVGQQNATMMMYTGRRIKGEEAVQMGLADVLVPLDQVRSAAMDLAKEIAISSPLGVVETRATMRAGLADRVRAATDHELTIQNQLRVTEDFQEGIKAASERRDPNFMGR